MAIIASSCMCLLVVYSVLSASAVVLISVSTVFDSSFWSVIGQLGQLATFSFKTAA